MQKNFIKAAKATGAILGGAALLMVWLNAHQKFTNFPQGKFWDPPSKSELPKNSAGGHKEKQALFDSLKLPSDTVNKK